MKKDRASHKHTIVAKFLTKRALNTDAVIRTFSPLWHSWKGFKVCNAEDHILLFVFDTLNSYLFVSGSGCSFLVDVCSLR